MSSARDLDSAAAGAESAADTKIVWSAAEVPEEAAVIAAAGFPPWQAELLARRGVTDGEGARAFLEPHLDQLHDPRRLAGLDAAVERLLQARQAQETVALVGDYDVDGVSGTAILSAVLSACGLTVHTIVPHRMRDGYGFQPVHVEEARSRGCGLIVTIDCGTSSIAAATAAGEAGLDVVVTDHHLPGEPLPDGVVLVNPRQPGCEYPFAELSGAGLALKLAMAVSTACGRPVDPRALMRIACLGTIADLVPLVGENRVIAAVGLEELRRTRSAGLRALIRVAGLQPPYSASDVGFRLGPRLNAPGRLDSADKALELLLCRDSHRAVELALGLDRVNRERQEWERRVVDEAREQILERLPLPPILVAWNESWHRGVVGIAAGRLARELHRPTLLLAVEGELASGSGRSISGVHLHDFIARWRQRLPKFGGHAQAIGLTVGTEELAGLRREWEAEAQAWQDLVAVRRYRYELSLDPGDLTPELVAGLARFEPHGQANRRPLVRIRGPLSLCAPARRFGNGHLSAEVRGPGGDTMHLVGWSWQPREASLQGDLELLGHLEIDRYRKQLVLRLVDARPFAPDPAREGESEVR